jgi:uncharacterized BrkB/YihY/UPF0761 family membrane protein
VSGRVDAFQRRHPAMGFPIAVVYKYFDDQGNYLAALMAYYAFIGTFPLLLISSSVLGFVLQDNEDLRNDVLDSALKNFPVIGDQLARPEGLQGSAGAIVVGLVLSLYGAINVALAAQNAMNVAWALPRNGRPNPLAARGRAIALLSTGGVGVLLISAISIAGTNAEGLQMDIGRISWLVTCFRARSRSRSCGTCCSAAAAPSSSGWSTTAAPPPASSPSSSACSRGCS